MGPRGDRHPYTALGAVGAMAMVAAAGISLAIAQRRKRPLYSRQEWEEALQEDGSISGFEDIVLQIVERGMDPNIRADVWPFLLEVFDPASTYAQRQHQHYLMTSQYQQLLLQCQAYEAVLKESLRPASPPQQPAPASGRQADSHHTTTSSSGNNSSGTGSSKPPHQHHHHHQQQQHSPQQLQQQLPEQVRQFAEAHRIIVIDSVRTDFQKHAAALQLQPDPGPCSNSNSTSYVSGGYASSIGVAAVAAVSQGLSSSLSTLQQWQQHWLGSLLGGQAAIWGHTQAQWVSEAAQSVLDSSSHLPDDSKRQASRMIAMLSAYALHDPDTGYCQGMSDLLLPLLLLMDDDALAFWCFVSLMQRLGARHNFAVDERGIFGQLRLLGQVLEAFDGPLMYQLKHLGAAECHFAYRMVVVMMRRDMPMPKLLQLWEVLWAYSWQHRHSSAHEQGQPAAAVEDDQQTQAASLSQAAAAAGAGTDDGSSKVPTPTAASASATVQLVAPTDSSSGGSGKHTTTISTDGGKGGGKAPAGSADGSGSSSLQPHEEPHLQLFICFVAAVIHSQRRTILDHCYNADDVLRLFHGVRRVDVWQCLDKALQLLQEVPVLQQQQQQQHCNSN